MPMQPDQLESLADPTKAIGRWVLNACAKVNRVSPIHAEYVGLLMSEPEVGAPLVLALDNRKRLTTSSIRKIEGGPNNSLFVDTANSRYWIRLLSQVGGTQ